MDRPGRDSKWPQSVMFSSQRVTYYRFLSPLSRLCLLLPFCEVMSNYTCYMCCFFSNHTSIFTGNGQFLLVWCIQSLSVKHFIYMFISLCNKHKVVMSGKKHHGLAQHSHRKWTAASQVEVWGLSDSSTSTPTHPIETLQLLMLCCQQQCFKLKPPDGKRCLFTFVSDAEITDDMAIFDDLGIRTGCRETQTHRKIHNMCCVCRSRGGAFCASLRLCSP